MNRLVAVLVFVCLVSPFTASAQSVPSASFWLVNCGDVVRSNVSYQFGNFNWVEYVVVTSRSLNSCPLIVSVEARVVNIPNSSLASTQAFAASVQRQVPVPAYGTYQTNGLHSFTVVLPTPVIAFFTYDLPPTTSHASVSEAAPDLEYDCMIRGGTWNGSECNLPNCPLIVDTAHDGYRLTNVANGVQFDLNADGHAERVAWTRADSDDAFLVLDRNGNGRIDDGSELFGNSTPSHADRPDETTPNGFEALKFLELGTYGASDRSEVIDSRDAVFARLQLWRDENHNGISEPRELQSVSAAGIVAIATAYKQKKRVDAHGNEFRQRGTIVWSTGPDWIFDVWLKWRE